MKANKYELIGQNEQKSTSVSDEIVNDFMLGLLHGFLLPLLFMAIMESRLALVYLLIPVAAYETVARHRGSKDFFVVFAIVIVTMTIASWADAVPQ